MDCKNRIISFIEQMMGYLTEDYLISLANKGIYNRGRKDLEKLEGTISLKLLEENKLQVDLGEGNLVEVVLPLQESRCSCPAQTICRHRMAAFLYCKTYYEKQKEEVENKVEQAAEVASSSGEGMALQQEPQMQTFSKELLELDGLSAEQLTKYFGKKAYQTALKKISSLSPLKFDYGQLVTISFEEGTKLYLPREKTLEAAICSCKAKSPCPHLLQAVLWYLIKEKGKELLVEEASFQLGEEEEAVLDEVKKELSIILDQGLSGLTPHLIKKLEVLYIKVYGKKFYELANELKRAASELGFYFSKNVSFSNQSLMYLICKMSNRIDAIKLQRNNPQKLSCLVGRLKAESLDYEKLSFWGIGLKCYLSKRQDAVITAYLYCEALGKVVTMTTLRPLEVGYYSQMRARQMKQSFNYLCTAPLVWGEEWPFEKLLNHELTVEGAVLSDYKLSTTKKSHGKLGEVLTKKQLEKLAVTDYGELREALMKRSYDYFEPYDYAQAVYLIKPSELKDKTYNEVAQRLEWMAYDLQGIGILLYMAYNEGTEEVIKSLEKETAFTYFLGHLIWKKDHLEAEIITVYKGEEALNLYG